MKIRSYNELRRLETFEERFLYLSLEGNVGESVFGFDRWINQHFYRSHEWKQAREHVILRDDGCDLGVPGYEIFQGLMVHHMNPITVDDVVHGNEWVLDPMFLITTTLQTHNAIHFGDASLIPRGPVERKPGDTKLW